MSTLDPIVFKFEMDILVGLQFPTNLFCGTLS